MRGVFYRGLTPGGMIEPMAKPIVKIAQQVLDSQMPDESAQKLARYVIKTEAAKATAAPPTPKPDEPKRRTSTSKGGRTRLLKH